MHAADFTEIDYEAIVSFGDLVAAYDQLAGRLRSLAVAAHLGRSGEFEDLVGEAGQRLLIDTPRPGHRFVHASVAIEQPGSFFVVPNERGKPGGAGGRSTARETLRACLSGSVNRMANNYAWAGLAERHGFQPDAIPADLFGELKPEAAAARDGERQRLLDALGTDWP